MMKRSINLSVVLALAISSYGAFMPHTSKSAWYMPSLSFKQKVMAGVVAAAILGVFIGYKSHGEQTRQAVLDAGVSPTSPWYPVAIGAVALFGPISDSYLKQYMSTIQSTPYVVLGPTLSKEQIASFWASDVGKALAQYKNMSQEDLIRRLGLQETAQKISADAAQGMFNQMKTQFQQYLKEMRAKTGVQL